MLLCTKDFLGSDLMIVFCCVDDKGGTMFNNRRQSRDSILIKRILEIAGDKKLYISPYSEKLFPEDMKERLISSPDYLEKAGEGDFLFCEDGALREYSSKIEKLVLFKWNRLYPADRFLDLELRSFKLTERSFFEGSSHEKIDEETYVSALNI